MKTFEFKNTLFDYFNNKIVEHFPELEGKIFRERLKIDKPQYPYICLKTGTKTRTNRRFENFYSEGKEYIRVQYSLPITFSVHDIKVNPIEAEAYTDEVIDYIELFFIANQTTHIDLNQKGIIINETMGSGVNDTSSFSNTAQEFIKETEIVFEFENIIETVPEKGKELDININCSY